LNNKPSLIEVAYDTTSTIVKSIGGMFKSGLDKIKGYVFQYPEEDQDRRRSRRRNSSVSSDSSYATARAASKSQPRYRSKSLKNRNKIVPFDPTIQM
jgi:hypothetical protein